LVQRLPVRLSLEDMPPDLPLHAGLSVTAEVDTKHQNPWMVWLDRSISRALGPAQAGETKH
jgi:multidrug resistance efflux pump